MILKKQYNYYKVLKIINIIKNFKYILVYNGLVLTKNKYNIIKINKNIMGKLLNNKFILNLLFNNLFIFYTNSLDTFIKFIKNPNLNIIFTLKNNKLYFFKDVNYLLNVNNYISKINNLLFFNTFQGINLNLMFYKEIFLKINANIKSIN